MNHFHKGLSGYNKGRLKGAWPVGTVIHRKCDEIKCKITYCFF